MAAQAVGELGFHFAIDLFLKASCHLPFGEVNAAKFAGKHYPGCSASIAVADGNSSIESDMFVHRLASRFTANGVRLAETKFRAQQALQSSDGGLDTCIRSTMTTSSSLVHNHSIQDLLLA